MTEKVRQYIQDKGIDTIRQYAIDFIKNQNSTQYPKKRWEKDLNGYKKGLKKPAEL